MMTITTTAVAAAMKYFRDGYFVTYTCQTSILLMFGILLKSVKLKEKDIDDEDSNFHGKNF